MLAVLEVTLVSKAASALVALVISAVILAVLEVTLVSKAASALVALVISAVILAVFAFTLVVNELILFVFAIMLAVFAFTLVGNVAMVFELTPPTLFTVVAKLPLPEPVTSPVKVVVAVADITSVPIQQQWLHQYHL
jgi:predicted ferric reductase